jgi:hypothetical protein
MALSTYTEIKAAVASWLNRSDLTTHIPDFISLAEVRINRDIAKLNLVGLEKRATATTVSGDAYLATPSRLLAIKSLKISGSPNRVLKYMTPDALSEVYNSTSTAKPYAYTVIGDEIKFAPIPDSAYTVEMNYCAKEQELSGSNATNWFTTNAPDLLLYGALMEAEPFMKNDERLATWSNMYSTALTALETMNHSLSFSGSGLEMRVV